MEMVNPLGALMQAEQIRGARNQNRLADLQYGQTQAKIQDQSRLRSLLPQAIKGDQAAIDQVGQIDPDMFMKLDENQRAAAKERAARLGNLFASVQSVPEELRPLAYNQAAQIAVRDLGIDPAEIKPYDPTQFKLMVDQHRKIEDILGKAPDPLEQERVNLQRQGLEIQRQRLAQDQEQFLGTQDTNSRRLDLMEEEGERKASSISPTVQKILDASQNAFIEADRKARRFAVLADQFDTTQMSSGAAASAGELLKQITGEQDAVTLLRKEYLNVRASQVVDNLPPGAASDADVKMALEGFLPETAKPQQVASFLRGLAKIQALEAEFQEFKSDMISQQGSTKNLIKQWRDYKGGRGGMNQSDTTKENANIEQMSDDDLKRALGL